MSTIVTQDHMLDWHSCQICYPLCIIIISSSSINVVVVVVVVLVHVVYSHDGYFLHGSRAEQSVTHTIWSVLDWTLILQTVACYYNVPLTYILTETRNARFLSEV